MRWEVTFSPLAEGDLIDLWRAIAPDGWSRADDVVDRIKARCDALADLPDAGRPRSELAKGLRSIPTVGPYIAFYRVRTGSG